MKTNSLSTKHALSGFSLVELLVVIAVLAVLASLLFPVVQKARSRALDVGCLNNLRSLGVAAHAFVGDNNGRLPMIVTDGSGGSMPGHQWDVQLAPYLGLNLGIHTETRTPFICPAAKRYFNLSFPLSRNLSYGLNTRVGQDVLGSGRPAQIQNASTLVMIADRERVEGSNENWLTLHGANSAIFIGDSASRLAVLPYERHGGKINILFADGHVAPRAKLDRTEGSFTANWPRGVRFYNGGPLSPSE